MEQTTPNIFTTSVANIVPGREICVEIAYLQPLPYQQGQYRFVFPMVVSPRYVMGTSESAEPLVPRLPAAITAPLRVPASAEIFCQDSVRCPICTGPSQL